MEKIDYKGGEWPDSHTYNSLCICIYIYIYTLLSHKKPLYQTKNAALMGPIIKCKIEKAEGGAKKMHEGSYIRGTFLNAQVSHSSILIEGSYHSAFSSVQICLHGR